MTTGHIQRMLLLLVSAVFAGQVQAQVNIKGVIYDRTLRIALQGVTVMSSSGKNALTDAKGKYQITLAGNDSIYFSYLNKRTAPFAVKSIEYPQEFDMSLDVGTDSLPPVTVWSKNYFQDSLDNRKEYEKVFNYGGEDLTSTGNNGGQVSPGFNLDLFFNMAKGRRMEAFQKRLIADEQDKFINHRFTKTLVTKITGLESPLLDSFMRQYRPSYTFIQSCETEYDYYKYILQSSRWFKEDWRALHPGETFAGTDSSQSAIRMN